ncbi:MAG: hypothetical protein JWN70_2451 [Planctomycetaceae bacterium]|nr:hypothetical protein [Planctomycetaceae bacterium]
MRALYAIVVTLYCAWLAGCESEQFRAETRLLADGSLDRIVYQPPDRVPNKGRQKLAWKEVRYVPKLESPDQQRRSLRDMLPLPDDAFRSSQSKSSKYYWLAQGQFATVNSVPDHLVFEAPKGLPDGRLVRKLERRDAGAVTEWIWEEVLTDVVTLTDQRLARAEAAELAVSLTVAACADAWGPDYDLKDFENWLRRDVTDCFQDVCDVALQMGLNKQKPQPYALEFGARSAKVLKQRGLDLLDAEQQPLKDQDEISRRVKTFLTENLQRLVRDKEGQPLKSELIQDALKGLSNESEDPPRETRLNQAFAQAVAVKFGTQEKFDEQVNRLGTRILGLYIWPILRAEQTFDYRLEVPGMILETNGQLTGDRTVRWKFGTSAAFPLGYAMRATVAVLDAAALVKHFPKAKFDRREVIVEYLELVAADPELRTALNDLTHKNDPTAWKAWQIDHLEATRLYELLQPATAGAP